MIIDAHAHAFPYIGGKGVYSSVEDHLRDLQRLFTAHPQGARRTRDNVRVTEPTLWDGKTVGFQGLLNVNFRVGRFGRFEWEKDGEKYSIQYFPPTLADMACPPELMLAQMDYIGVGKALLQFTKTYGVTNEYLSEVVRKWPTRFRACTSVRENDMDEEQEILSMRQAVRGMGLTALYFSNDGFAPSGYQNHFDDDKYAPFWEEVQSLGIPVVWDIRITVKRNDHNTYMREAGRFHRQLKRYPRIQNVLSHCVPSSALDSNNLLPDDLLKMLKEPNLTVELVFPILWGSTWEYPYTEARPIIQQLYSTLGPTKLMWGADMPNVERSCTYLQSLDYLRKHCSFISPADMELILGRNADRLYFLIEPAGAMKEGSPQ